MVLCTAASCCGAARAARADGVGDVALLRVEQLYPLHEGAAAAAQRVAAHAGRRAGLGARGPQNRGAWTYLEARLRALPDRRLTYVGREASASPYPGSLH
ncbi:MAG: hypothetical protein IPG96_20440 [Proteobacteria bacterium]|nr:hypothetical protein [Pseudomonadota bacterium]